MDGERYPGERRGLTLFLAELQPAVERIVGRDSLLYHRIRAALRRGDLAALRSARQMFNNQPRALKQRLSLAIYGAEPASRASERGRERNERRRGRPPGRAQGTNAVENHGGIENAQTLLEDGPVVVLVRPDSLPGTVAARLRRIADRIERNDHLLAGRPWHEGDSREGGSPRSGTLGDNGERG